MTREDLSSTPCPQCGMKHLHWVLDVAKCGRCGWSGEVPEPIEGPHERTERP